MAGGGAAGRAAQNELQEAISAHASSKQTDEYSDDFESDEDGMLNGIEEEFTEGYSRAASIGESVAIGSSLLNDDASQKLADLENEPADDLTSSFHEEELQKIMVLEGDNISDDRKDGKEECLEGRNEGNDRKNNEALSAAEDLPCDNSDSDDLPIHELHKKRNQEEKQPTVKPRLHKQRNTSSSGEDQKTVNTNDLKLEDNGRKSSSVIEQMMTTAYEKTRELENPTPDSSDGTMKIAEGQIITGTMQEVSVNGQSEHREAKHASKSTVKKPSETKERVLQNSNALSDRSPSSGHLKTKMKAVPSATPVSSQYLGSLNLLEDKCMQKKRTEFDKADNLRAAVFQNWLEKKKRFLMELKRTEKEKAENLKNDTEKKEALRREESIACFEAWKKKKAREAKMLSEKKKLEELEEKTPEEQNKEKIEAAQVAFKRWKERKVEYLREQSRKEKESERIRKEKEEELIAEKRRVSISAVEKWIEKKEEYIKKKKVEKFLERKKQEMQRAKKELKNEKAIEEYERWLENKERREELEKKQKKLQSVHGNEMSPPWRPPGKVKYSGYY
ncbi:microtubule-associated protein 9 [Empidonax traillii]|uniref:microtubule-associated protein 9 n=1 Tax=Empidonax traillii TaxID=164674 RepID=UPI000FFD0A11|nr:microtubule-associated protein 9 [Empidonax traillii]